VRDDESPRRSFTLPGDPSKPAASWSPKGPDDEHWTLVAILVSDGGGEPFVISARDLGLVSDEGPG
jgi:hypothetical protein